MPRRSPILAGSATGYASTDPNWLSNLANYIGINGLGEVFFDIDSDGTYKIAAPGGDSAPPVGGIGGITFDSTVVPEPSTAILALFGAAVGFMRRRR